MVRARSLGGREWTADASFGTRCELSSVHWFAYYLLFRDTFITNYPISVEGGHMAVIFDRFAAVKNEVVGEGTRFFIPWSLVV